ncbi:MAG: hypothetical protein J6G98_04720 [Bacilli bacterium]|nr:hypothetical protein [Bacilli bacterium]
MYTEYGKYNDESVYLNEDSILFVKGKNSEKYVQLTNELEVMVEKRNSLRRGISYNKNRLAKGKFTKQKISKFLYVLALLIAIVASLINHFIPFINISHLLGSCIVLIGINSIDDILQESAKIDCDNKIKHLEKEIDRCNLNIKILEDLIDNVKKEITCNNITVSKINKIDELKRIRDTYQKDYNIKNVDKTYKKLK